MQTDIDAARSHHEQLHRAFFASPEVEAFRRRTTRIQPHSGGLCHVDIRMVMWPGIIGDGLALLRGRGPLEATVEDLRAILLDALPAHRPLTRRDAEEVLEELDLWFRWLAEHHEAPNAGGCRAWLAEPSTRAALFAQATEVEAPPAFRPARPSTVGRLRVRRGRSG